MEAEGKGLLLGDCKQTRLGSETAKPEVSVTPEATTTWRQDEEFSRRTGRRRKEVHKEKQLDQKRRDLERPREDLEKTWRNSLIKLTVLCVCNVIMLYHISTFEIFK